MSDLAIIMAAFIVLGMLFIGAIVDWRKLSVKWTGNNLAKATVYVVRDDEVFPRPGRIAHEAEDGTWYSYRWLMQRLEVLVPPDYPTKFTEGKRIISVVSGSTVATDLPQIVRREDSVSAVDVATIVQGRVMNDLVKSISGGAMPSWLIPVAVALVVVVIGYYVTQVNPELLGGITGNAGGGAPPAPVVDPVIGVP